VTPPNRSFALRSCLRLLTGAAAAVLAACTEKTAPPPSVPEVSVVEVIQRDVPIGAELTATMNGFEDVELRARVEGYLRSIDYSEGSQVNKGQLMFTIEDSQYRQKVAEATATLTRAQAALSKADLDVSRYRPLAAERAISQAELDNAIAAQKAARAQVDAGKAGLENARLNLGYTRIAAPIDGLAGRAQRKVGDLVGKGEPTLLATMSSIDPIRVTVNMPESLYLRYANELKAISTQQKDPKKQPPPQSEGPRLVLADGSSYPEPGRLILVDRSVDPQTGTLRADLAFPNPKHLLRPGLYAKVRYKEEVRSGALLVPQRAVQELQGQFSVVLVNAEGKCESHKVKPGPRVGSLWILEDGVKRGDKVIVEGLQKVRDGMVVKATVVPTDPLAQATSPPTSAPGTEPGMPAR